MGDLIRQERHGPVMVWTLDRADRLNALPDLGDGEAFASACEAVNADMSVRCVVLTGTGRAFCTGQDLKEHIGLLNDAGGDALSSTVDTHYNPIVTTIATMARKRRF